MNKELLEKIKKTIVFIGFKTEKVLPNGEGYIGGEFVGTGVLIQINNYFHLITAKHVIANLNNDNSINNYRKGLYIFNNIKNNPNAKFTSIDNLLNNGHKYYIHNDNNIDLAILSFPVDDSYDVMFIDIDNFSININNLYETNDIFFLSYQPGISNLDKDINIKPVIRKGIISRINNDGSLYIDGAAFPGNSGSPVFLLPSAIQHGENGFSIGLDVNGGKFIGIISEYTPYQEVAISKQTGRERIIFEENTGLSKVWGVNKIKEIINSQIFQDYLNSMNPTTS